MGYEVPWRSWLTLRSAKPPYVGSNPTGTSKLSKSSPSDVQVYIEVNSEGLNLTCDFKVKSITLNWPHFHDKILNHKNL